MYLSIHAPEMVNANEQPEGRALLKGIHKAFEKAFFLFLQRNSGEVQHFCAFTMQSMQRIA